MKFKYPKLTLVGLIILASYFIFSNPAVKTFVSGLNSIGYFGAFIGGLLYTYGFTGPIAAGFFIDLELGNIWFGGLLGGFGALLSDLLIFNVTKFELMDEFTLLKKTRLISRTSKSIEKIFGETIRRYLAYLLAAVFIASPLPDEAGVIMIAGLTKINRYVFLLTSFFCNTAGILVLMSL